METGSRRMPGTGLLITSGVILVGAVVLIAVVGGRRVVDYEPGTPEASAQSYVQAMLDRDFDLAHGYLSSELQDQCEPYRLEIPHAAESMVVTFSDVRVDGDSAAIEARLASTDFQPELFPFEEPDIDTRLVLEQRNGDWRIVRADWPLYGCARGEP